MWKAVLILVALLLPLQAISKDYQIRPGDTLLLEVLEDEAMRRSVLVLPDGSVSLPLAGTIPVAGLTVPQVEALVRGKIGPNYVSAPTIHVSVARLSEAQRNTAKRSRATAGRPSGTAGISVYAMGELGRPGKLTVPRGTTMMQLLAEAGGFTRFAASSRVLLRRVDAKTKKIKAYRINARSMMNGGTQMVVLQQGDVIVVPERKLFE